MHNYINICITILIFHKKYKITQYLRLEIFYLKLIMHKKKKSINCINLMYKEYHDLHI